MPKSAPGGKEKKPKKVKDPMAPKKPSGAYMWFCKDMRDDIKKEHPERGVTDIGRRLGELWKSTSDEEKKKYYIMAEEDKERYNKDMSSYHGA